MDDQKLEYPARYFTKQQTMLLQIKISKIIQFFYLKTFVNEPERRIESHYHTKVFSLVNMLTFSELTTTSAY